MSPAIAWAGLPVSAGCAARLLERDRDCLGHSVPGMDGQPKKEGLRFRSRFSGMCPGAGAGEAAIVQADALGGLKAGSVPMPLKSGLLDGSGSNEAWDGAASGLSGGMPLCVRGHLAFAQHPEDVGAPPC